MGHTGTLLAPAAFRDAMAEVCAPVTVVTALVDGRPHGTTVSAFASLSLEPPMVTVALDRRSHLLALVRREGRLGVNVLGSGQDALAVQFARKGVDKFEGVAWTSERGLPRLDRAIAWLDCSVASVVEGGDHVIVLARVHSADVTPAPPLTYHRRGFGTHATLMPAGEVS